MPRLREVGQPSWPQILQAVIDKAQRNIHGAMPGRVRSYNIETQTAEVQLLVRIDGEAVAPLLDVPVCWPSGIAGHLHVPLTAGDTVLVVFVDEDYGKWWGDPSGTPGGSVVAPEVEQRHGMHPVAIPGFRREVEALPVTGGHVTLAATAELRLGADDATDPVALAPGLAAVLGDFIAAVKTVIGAAVDPTGIPTAAKATFATAAEAIEARIAAGEMAAEKVRAT